MRLTRVHVDSALAAGAEVELPEAAAAHLARVLRLQAGDECVLFNGDGMDYPARIVASNKRSVRVLVGTPERIARESPLRIVLLQGIARGEKMDLILQKATELGVAQVRPLTSQRSEVKLDAERAARRVAHWRQVVVAACEQSGRAVVPEVLVPAGLAAVLEGLAEPGLRLILDPSGTLALAPLRAPAHATVVLAVGPEGGWSPLDRQQLLAAGFEGLRLGPRVLRTETAALAAISALQARFGDFD
ncbi:MAG: 16S rRNA (uracil(1498)-N(3))-methyltransferase [Pseudomonadota bacterium]|nr:16S rRNA (uracil(1498)-N(3))-methyltransferase [Pseudomonadota bacterium]